jgi:hypothetical protein
MYTRVVYRLILCGCPSDLAPAGGVAAAGGPKWADSEGVRRFSAAYYADVLVRREIVHIYIYIYIYIILCCRHVQCDRTDIDLILNGTGRNRAE